MLPTKSATLLGFPIFLTVYVHGVIHGYLSSGVQINKETVLLQKGKNETVSPVLFLQSHGYPEVCCQSYAYEVVSDDLRVGDCILLVFEDLDLPFNASLMVLETTENGSSVIFQYVSDTQENVFLCDSLKICRRNSSLLIILKHEGNASLPFVGFKARLWASGVGSSFSAFETSSALGASQTVPCKVLEVIVPREQMVRSIVSFDRVLDYVWVVKVAFVQRCFSEFVICLEISVTEFEGHLEVRSGVHSDAAVILQRSLMSSNESMIKFSLESVQGFHVRLRVQPNVTAASIAFVAETCKASVNEVDNGSDSFLKWLLPLVGGFVLIGICVFILKIYMKSKYRHNDQCNNLEIIHPVHSVRLPLLQLPSQAPGGEPLQERSSVIFIPSGPHRHITFAESPQSGSHNSSFPRTAPIPVPMTRSAPIAIPIVVRPQVHRDGQLFPPSYEEVTADHSCGNSSESLDELEKLPEYHPPSYEDASQGKMGVVSSWLSSSEQPQLQPHAE